MNEHDKFLGYELSAYTLVVYECTWRQSVANYCLYSSGSVVNNTVDSTRWYIEDVFMNLEYFQIT